MIRGLALAATAALAISGVAQAAPVVSSHFSTDAAFLSLLSGRGVTLPANGIFAAQARAGNNGANGDYEAGLHVPPNFTDAWPIGAAGQFAWGGAARRGVRGARAGLGAAAAVRGGRAGAAAAAPRGLAPASQAAASESSVGSSGTRLWAFCWRIRAAASP